MPQGLAASCLHPCAPGLGGSRGVRSPGKGRNPPGWLCPRRFLNLSIKQRQQEKNIPPLAVCHSPCCHLRHSHGQVLESLFGSSKGSEFG